MKSILIPLLFITINAVAQKPFALVELFTSEGCSSCPPADELLNKLSDDAKKSGQRIFTLAYHVDYWNKLGWKDPYSKLQYTVRQENYSRVIAGKEVYTPQAIINGTFACVGSKKEIINESVQKALTKPASFDLKIMKDSIISDSLYLSYSIPLSKSEYVMRIALTEDDLTNKIGKGENVGKTLHHNSVVRSFFSIDKPERNGQTKIALKVFSGKGDKHLIAFVQIKKTMEILAVEEIELDN